MTPGPARPRLDNSLIGRHWELAELTAGLEDARQGRGRLFLLTGDAGIGKTRLVEALAEVAEPTDVRVRWGRCWEGGGAPPYWPWTQILREELADVDPATLGPAAGHLAQLVPELGDRDPALRPRAASDVPSARGALFDAVFDLLRHRRAESALVVVLEDLHAADDASLRLLQHVARELASAPLMVVGTYRDPEVRSSPVLHQRMAALARHGRRVLLGGLHEDAVATLLERVSGTARLAELARDVHHLTDGNPLFVQEVARLLMAQRPRGDDGELVGSVRVPEEVHALIRRRVEPLGEDVRRVLTFAAVLGRDFDLTVLSRLTEAGPDELLDALEHAALLDVVESAGLGRWRFSHALLREALYNDVRPSQRVTLHRQAGEALESIHPDGAGHEAELAHHFFEAARGGEGGKAVEYCTRAGRQAMARLAFEDAGLFYGRALEALALSPPAHDGRRYELLMGLAQAQQRAGDLAMARETFQRAAKCARTLASPELLARAAIGYAGFIESQPDDARASLLEEALAALPPGDHPLRATMLALLGQRVQTRRSATAEAHRRNWERGRDMTTEAVAMARRLGDPETLRQVLFTWHFAARRDPDTLRERVAVSDELVQLALDAGDAEGLVLARQWRSADLFSVGDLDAMAAELTSARAEAHALRMPFLQWAVAMQEGGLALLRGDLEAADRLIHEALRHGERAEFADVEDAYTAQLAHLRSHQGRFAELEQVLRSWIDRHDGGRTGDCIWTHLGQVAAHAGRAEEARTLLDQLRATVASRPEWRIPCCEVNFAELAWLLDAGDGAEEVYGRLLPWAGRHLSMGVANYSFGGVDRYLGQLATLLGRYDAAEAHFEAAHRVHARLRTPLWDAYTRADHARMLLKRCARGDREQAEALVETARRAFRDLGMGFYEQRAAALLDTVVVAAASDVTQAPSVDRARLTQEGEYWAFDYGGTVVRLKDSKGVRYLARLLRNPGQEQHALDIMTNETERGRRPADAGPVLDDRAKAAYRRRMEDLRQEIEEATAFNDLGRIAQAQEEMDFLISEVKAAVGMGGRDRKAASDTERARQSVTRAVKGTVERLADANPALGEHLRSTIRTGVYSAYVPDPRAPIVWMG